MHACEENLHYTRDNSCSQEVVMIKTAGQKAQVLATLASELFLFWGALSIYTSKCDWPLHPLEVVSFREFLDTSHTCATGVFG